MTAMVCIICPAGLPSQSCGAFLWYTRWVYDLWVKVPTSLDREKVTTQGKGVFTDKEAEGIQANLLIRVNTPLYLTVT